MSVRLQMKNAVVPCSEIATDIHGRQSIMNTVPHLDTMPNRLFFRVLRAFRSSPRWQTSYTLTLGADQGYRVSDMAAPLASQRNSSQSKIAAGIFSFSSAVMRGIIANMPHKSMENLPVQARWRVCIYYFRVIYPLFMSGTGYNRFPMSESHAYMHMQCYDCSYCLIWGQFRADVSVWSGVMHTSGWVTS